MDKLHVYFPDFISPQLIAIFPAEVTAIRSGLHRRGSETDRSRTCCQLVRSSAGTRTGHAMPPTDDFMITDHLTILILRLHKENSDRDRHQQNRAEKEYPSHRDPPLS